MSKRQPLMINRTDPPLAKGVCDPKGRRWEPIPGSPAKKAEWERRKELSDTVRAGATAHCVQIVTAAQFPNHAGLRSAHETKLSAFRCRQRLKDLTHYLRTPSAVFTYDDKGEAL